MSANINIKIIILFGLVGLVLIVGSIAGTLYFTGFFSGATGGEHVTEQAPTDYSHMPPIYLDIKPTFIANAVEGDRLHYVMADISVMSRNQSAIDGVSANLFAIRNNVREALSGHAYSELLSKGGIERLRATAEQSIKEYLESRHLPLIDAFYFISVIVQ
ncbi:flagellar FliL protein [Gammaproteobacteria bacterium]